MAPMSWWIVSIGFCFAALGVLQAQVGARMPSIKDELSLSNGDLATILVADDVGQLAVLAMAGEACRRWGSPVVTRVSLMLLCCALPLVGLAPGPRCLAAALAVVGSFGATLDVAMNAEASDAERVRGGSPMMSRFHGLFSVGFGFGGVVAGLEAGLSLTPMCDFMLASVMVLVTSIGVVWALGGSGDSRRSCNDVLLEERGNDDRDDTGERAHGSESQGTTIALIFNRQIMAVGLAAFIGSVGEGSMLDWSSVYFRDTLGTTEAWAPAGFVAFNVMMTAVRFAGDHITEYLSPSVVLLAGSLTAGIGLLAASLVPATFIGQTVALFGFGAVGIGLATVIPIAFSAAGKVDGVDPGVGIGFVSTIAYSGMLVGPPLIGGIAQVMGSLRAGIALDGVLVLSISVFSLAIGGSG